MDTQNQNIQPDYSFITNQPNLPTPKKPKGKLIFIGFGAFILLVGFAGAMLALTTRNVKQQNTATNQNVSYTQTAESFMSYMSTTNSTLDSSVVDLVGGKLYFGSTTNLYLLQRLADSLDFKSCQQAGVESSGDAQNFIYQCKTKTDQGITFILTVQKLDNKYVVTGNQVKTNA